MPEPLLTPPPKTDPYSEFQTDPYAEFGGQKEVAPPPQAPQQSRFATAVKNFIPSLKNAVTHPSFVGQPSDMENPDEHRGDPFYDIREMWHGLTHPEEDPVGAGLNVAQLGRGVRRLGTGGASLENPVTPEVGRVTPESGLEIGQGAAKGAYKGATTMVPLRRHGLGMDVPAPIAGAAMGGLVSWPFEHIPVVGKYVPPMAAGVGAAAPVVMGGARGAREAIQNIMHREGGNPPPGPSVGPQPEGPAPGPVGPVPRPALPSGRKVGAMPPETPQAGPVSAPGTSPPPNQATPQITPIEAASKDTHPPGVTQADEFKGSVVPPPAPQGLAPSQGIGPVSDPTKPVSIPHFNRFSQTGGPYKVVSKGGATLGTYDTLADAQKGVNNSNFANGMLKVVGPQDTKVSSSTQPQLEGQVTDPRLSRASIQKHLEGIAKKTENVKAYATDPAHQITVEELESLKNDLTQADDPAKYHAAIQKAKTMGKEVYSHAKGRGAPIPDSPYRTFSLDDIDTAIKALQSRK